MQTTGWQASISRFFQADTLADFLRIMKIPALTSLEAGKWVMMWYCGCQINELNNWMSHAIRTPYYWRIPTPPSPPYVAGPYSPIWYLINQPARFGYYPWMIYLFAFDLLLTGFNFFKHGWKWILWYSGNSIIFYDSFPTDFFVFNIACLGIYSLKWSGFDILFKVPWITLPFSTPVWFPFPPAYVWPFVLNDPYGFHESPLRYAQLALVWLIPIVLYYHRRKRRLTKLSGLEKSQN